MLFGMHKGVSMSSLHSQSAYRSGNETTRLNSGGAGHRYFGVVALLLLACGCSSVYYGTMAKFGYEKRDILVNRVKDARNDQDAAKEDFKTTLQRAQEVTNINSVAMEASIAEADSFVKGLQQQ